MRLNDLPLKPIEAIHLVLAVHTHASIPLRQHFRNVLLEALFYLKTKTKKEKVKLRSSNYVFIYIAYTYVIRRQLVYPFCIKYLGVPFRCCNVCAYSNDNLYAITNLYICTLHRTHETT